nr:PREDICTED: CMP-N-acetylneuraminate-beta-galactosamide-alpha-2,3-sialyltransferase 4-like [Apteryx mantelli mantelli]
MEDPGGSCEVTSGSRDESSSPRVTPPLAIKMIKSRGKILGVLALFLVMVWYSISREDRYIQLYTRDRPLFLQLKDYFWVRTPSLYELPYGTKGSEDILLRLLSVTSYAMPESIQSLKCRRCAVVGNGHRLRNSSMGETINTYDVVISFYFPLQENKTTCPVGEVEKKAAQLIAK